VQSRDRLTYPGYGVNYPTDYPKEQYGTEVFETNTALQDIAFNFALKGNLSDNPVAAEYRQKYASAGAIYAAATTKPTVVKCDTATSDVYYSGTLLSEAFENTTTLWTNGTGVYCMTAQEDSAILEVMVRGAIFGLVDYSRIILMRTGELVLDQ
jgi:purine nucleoside permease